MRKRAGVIALVVAVTVSGCTGSDSGGEESSGSEHVPDDSVEPIKGDTANGIWLVYVDTMGQLCGATGPATSPDPASLICGTTDDLAITLHDAAGKPIVVFGMTPEGTVGIRTPDGQESWSGWSGTEAPDGRMIYAMQLRGEPIPTEIAFHNRDAGVIDTARVDR
jgi:hypothetical protein